MSQSSFNVSSKLGGPTHNYKQLDDKKMEKINKSVYKMIHEKIALDCALSTIQACMDAFKSCSHATIFIIDKGLQLLV